MWRLGALLVFVGGCNACSGSKGTLVNPGADVSFVTESGAVVVSSQAGIAAVALDGSRERTLFAERMKIEDVSGDYRIWVGTDADTNLFLGELGAGNWRRVKELDGIASAAAISPDGTRVIASRHSDFDKPGSEQDDTLFLIDVTSLEVEMLAKTASHWPVGLAWSEDGDAVLARMAFDKPSQWIDMKTKKRIAASAPPVALYSNPARLSARCSAEVLHEKFDTEIKVQDSSGKVVTVVREEGRKRGFHDYQSDFGQPELTPKCGYVLFSWQGAAWLADAKGSGQLGPLVDGEVLFFADLALLSL